MGGLFSGFVITFCLYLLIVPIVTVIAGQFLGPFGHAFKAVTGRVLHPVIQSRQIILIGQPYLFLIAAAAGDHFGPAGCCIRCRSA